MISKGHHPNVMTCSTLINGLWEGEIEKAELVDEIISKGLEPDIMTCTPLQTSFARLLNLRRQ
jgi:hypothetical protein